MNRSLTFEHRQTLTGPTPFRRRAGRRMLLVALLVLPSVVLRAQEADEQRPGRAAMTTEVFEFDHARRQAVTEVLHRMNLPMNTAWLGDDRLLLRGDPDTLREFIEQIAPQIDRPGVGDADDREAIVIPLDQLGPDAVRVVHNLISDQGGTVAYDRLSNCMVFTGRTEDARLVREVIKSMDVVPSRLRVDLYLVKASIGTRADDRGGADELPAFLLPIGKALQANGFEHVSLLTSLQVVTNEREDFEQVAPYLLESGEAVDQFRILLQGRARLAEDKRTAVVSLETGLHGTSAVGENRNQVDFEVQTTLAAQLGDFTILAAGPGRSTGGNAMAIVIRVTKL